MLSNCAAYLKKYIYKGTNLTTCTSTGAPLDGSSSSVLSLFVLILLCSTWYFIFNFLPLVDSYTRNLLDILLCDQMDTLIVFNGYILSDFYLISLNVGICDVLQHAAWLFILLGE